MGIRFLWTTEPLKFLDASALSGLHVGPGRKRLACPGKDRDPGGIILVKAAQLAGESAHKVRIKRIELLGSVQRNCRDVPIETIFHQIGHGWLSEIVALVDD